MSLGCRREERVMTEGGGGKGRDGQLKKIKDKLVINEKYERGKEGCRKQGKRDRRGKHMGQCKEQKGNC